MAVNAGTGRLPMSRVTRQGDLTIGAVSQSEIEGSEGTDAVGLHFRPRVFLPLILFLALAVHLLLPRIAVLDQSLRVFWSLSIGVVAAAVAAQASSYFAN